MAQPDHANLLLEIGCEEIPASFIRSTLQQVQEALLNHLQEERLEHGQAETYGTPRRLIIYVQNVATRQTPEERTVRGPARRACFDAQGNPTQALLGFARSQGVEPEAVQFQETPQGEYAVVQKLDPGKSAVELLSEALLAIIRSLSFPKTLRWGEGNLRFARPIRWLLTVLGAEVIPFEIEGVQSGNRSRGHRFLAPDEFVVKNPSNFLTQLRDAHVMYDPDERKELIRQEAIRLAAQVNGQAVIEEDLLEENVFLVEYPHLLLGSFPEEFLDLPTPVLISAMKKHQKFFPVVDEKGQLLPYFISVYNSGQEESVREGNEWVLVARLNDAKFFYEADLKQPLEAFVPRLERILFQQQLGSLLDKTRRLENLSGWLAKRLGWSKKQAQTLERAAYLCKADLATQMVMELPDLQGIIGREYALKSGEPEPVAQAIGEHYRPRYAGDELPQTEAGRALAVLDRMDTLVGYVGLGYLPKGSSDPFGLRRSANGIVEILANEPDYPPLDELVWGKRMFSELKKAMLRMHYNEVTEMKVYEGMDTALRPLSEVWEDLRGLFNTRLEAYLEELGVRYDLIRATLGGGWNDSVYSTVQRALFLQQHHKTPEFQRLVTTAIRPANILSAAEKKGIVIPERGFVTSESISKVDSALFEHEVELHLYETLLRLIGPIAEAERKHQFETLYGLLQEMDEPVNRLFDHVMVMCEDESVRQNRLNLLACANRLYRALADFTQIV